MRRVRSGVKLLKCFFWKVSSRASLMLCTVDTTMWLGQIGGRKERKP